MFLQLASFLISISMDLLYQALTFNQALKVGKKTKQNKKVHSARTSNLCLQETHISKIFIVSPYLSNFLTLIFLLKNPLFIFFAGKLWNIILIKCLIQTLFRNESAFHESKKIVFLGQIQPLLIGSILIGLF